MAEILNRLARIVLCGFVAAVSTLPGRGADKTLDFALLPDRQVTHLPSGEPMGACSAVCANSQGEIYYFHRGPRPIVCTDAEGNLLRTWGDDVIKTAHGLRVDADDNVWVTDVGGHRVIKFDPRGNVLLTLGTGEPGMRTDQFHQPTDIGFSSKGDVFVSDGYGNSRVMKFDREGLLLKTWGSAGTRAGQFQLPHSLVVDRDDRVLVGDRENNRIQVFDADGNWQATWRGFAPYGMAFDPDGRLFVADGRANQILLLDEHGKVRKRWGRQGNEPGEYRMPHMLAFDAVGNLFVAEVDGQRFQKLQRKSLSKSSRGR